MWVTCRSNWYTKPGRRYKLKLTVGKRYKVMRRFKLDFGLPMYEITRDDGQMGKYAERRFTRTRDKRLLLCT